MTSAVGRSRGGVGGAGVLGALEMRSALIRDSNLALQTGLWVVDSN